MAHHGFSRRGFIGTGLVSGFALTGAASAEQPASDGFAYEVTRSDAEWKERLSKNEYNILREAGTELPKSDPLWEEARNGNYFCKGCDLHVYDATWKVPLDKGWAFFRHSVPNSVLLGIDGPTPEFGNDTIPASEAATIETHCRRCGSHLGHILIVDTQQLHCINGTSLTFTPLDA